MYRRLHIVNSNRFEQVVPFLPKELRDVYQAARDLSYQNVSNMTHHPLLNNLKEKRDWYAASYVFNMVSLLTLMLAGLFPDLFALCGERRYYFDRLYSGFIIFVLTGIGEAEPRTISGTYAVIILALFGWLFFNTVSVLLSCIKLSEIMPLVRYDAKMKFVAQTFDQLNDKKFRKEDKKEIREKAEDVNSSATAQKTQTSGRADQPRSSHSCRFEADFKEIVKGFQLRWLLYQDLNLLPENLCKFMDSCQIVTVRTLGFFYWNSSPLLI